MSCNLELKDMLVGDWLEVTTQKNPVYVKIVSILSNGFEVDSRGGMGGIRYSVANKDVKPINYRVGTTVRNPFSQVGKVVKMDSPMDIQIQWKWDDGSYTPAFNYTLSHLQKVGCTVIGQPVNIELDNTLEPGVKLCNCPINTLMSVGCKCGGV